MVVRKDVKWIRWGRQKRAVLLAITHPMTPTEISEKVKQVNSRITFGDTSTLIQEFKRREILECLTPNQPTGKIYFFTPYGLRLIRLAFGVTMNPHDESIDWDKYSRLKAGKTRLIVLKSMFSNIGFYPEGINLTTIRKIVNRISPITLSRACGTVQTLLKNHLIEIAGNARKYNSKLYKLTKEGLRLCEYLETIFR